MLRDFTGEADMKRAAEQVLENLVTLLHDHDPLLINHIDIEIPVSAGPTMQVNVSRDGEPVVNTWQVPPDDVASSPSP